MQHQIQETKIKKTIQKRSFINLVKLLAKKKAESIVEDYPVNIIIGSDQILVCDGKLINKSRNLLKQRKI